MSKIESGFIPLPKVEKEQPSDHLEMRLNLPTYLDQDRIGVNIRRVDSLCKLSGIRTISIIGKQEGETSNAVPNIVGFNSDGSAIASKTSAKTDIPTFDSFDQHTRETKIGAHARRTDVSIGLNLNEISQQIIKSNQEIRNPKAWAKKVDYGFRTAVRNLGTDNLIQNTTTGNAPLDFGIFVNNLFMLNNLGYMTRNLAESDYFQLSEGILVVSAVMLLKKWRLNEPTSRSSYFWGPQYDRAAILQACTRTQKLVTDLHPDKK